MSAKFDFLPATHLPIEDKLAEQIERILRSQVFQGSEILRHLLSYLASCAIANRIEPVKVKEIATVVFGRSADFDSQNDSVVRVHTGRLRSKLAEYYMSEGAEDELIVGIPKGSYALSWHYRQNTPLPNSESAETAPQAIPQRPKSEATPKRDAERIVISLQLVIIAGLAALCINSYMPARLGKQAVPEALRTFWRPFTSSEGTPLIVFSHLEMTSGPDGNMRFRSADDEGKPVIDTYTTIGEVMGVFNVTRTFALLQKPVRTKGGQLLTWDDAEDSNLVFVGGPLAKTPLRDVSILRDFEFHDRDAANPSPLHWVVNVHPGKGEQRIFVGPDERPFTFDYAVIALRPAFSRSHVALALAGITEYGTWAAADFVTREEHVKELLARLNVGKNQAMPFFEALLKVKMQGGVPVQSDILILHKVR